VGYVPFMAKVLDGVGKQIEAHEEILPTFGAMAA
jgi:hypothetical protein